MTTAVTPTCARLLSVSDAADHLGLSIDHVRRLIRRRELAAVRIGRRVLVHSADLTAFIELHRL